MPQRSAVTQLPDEIRDALERELIERGFADYEALSQWLEQQGYEISKSALHRHGQKLERKLSAIKASTEAASLIAEAAPDDQDQRSAAVLSLVQTDLFEALLCLQEAEEADPAQRIKLLSRAGRAIADVSRASVSQKKWAQQVAAKLAAATDAFAKRQGLSKTQAEDLRREMLGVVA